MRYISLNALILLFVVGMNSLKADSTLTLDSSTYSRVDTLQTLSSFRRLGNFWMMDYQGDYEYILDEINSQYYSCTAPIPEGINCSLISSIADTNKLFLGRNFDNPNQDVLIARYDPPGQYASIALNRLSDLGYPLGTNYVALSDNSKKHLLKAPYYAADGINECGLAAGLAYVPSVPIVQYPDKEYIYITLLQRKILDQAATCAEALAIANSYNVYDTSYAHNVISHHILVADSNGESAILEYVNDQFVSIPAPNPWQVLTNSPIYNVSNTDLMTECWRYATLYQSLASCGGDVQTWRNAMDILSQATWYNQGQGTQWSTIADICNKGLYVSIDRDFNNIAYLDIADFQCQNYGNIEIDDITIVDEDTDGSFEPGENLSILLFLVADFPTSGIIGQININNINAEIHNGISSFDDMTEDLLCSMNHTPFSITMAGESDLTCTVTFTTDYGYECTTSFVIPYSPTANEDNVSQALVDDVSCHPNPTNNQANICFSLKQNSPIRLCIYNLRGQMVRTLSTADYTKGNHTISWDCKDDSGSKLSSGVYFIRLEGEEKQVLKKMVLKG